LANLELLQNYDKSGMYKIYDRWPQIALNFFEKKWDEISFKDIEHIVFAGMGGSGTIGDVFASILSRSDIHISVVKGYLLPKTVNSNTLIVTTSISGDTHETLEVLTSAQKITKKIIAFSSGGKIENFCSKNNIEFRKIEQFHSPRASFSSFLYSILKSLMPILPITNQEVLDSISSLKNLNSEISSSNLNDDNPSLKLAEGITGIPIIYYPHGLQASAIRFKNSLQENAKIHAMAEDVIEACHNGVVSWKKKDNLCPILIEGKDDYIKTKERWKIIKQFFDEKKINYKEIFSPSGGILTKVVYLIYLLDYASIYLAIKNKTDPTPIDSIDYIKKRI